MCSEETVCEQRYCGFSVFFTVWLPVLMLSLCAEKLFFLVFMGVFVLSDCCRGQIEMGWEKHEERPCALQKQRDAFDRDTAAS